MSNAAAPAAFVEQNQQRYLDELFDLLRFASVSTDPARKQIVADCATFVRDHLAGIGLTASIHPTPGHPVVYAEDLRAGAGAPTILVYGHYDVQPPEPLELWRHGPFEPVIENGQIIARGSTDDKGQVFTHIKGVEAWLKTVGKLPVNVKFLIEGEEEIGSPNLEPWLKANAARLACDAVIISDSSMFAPGLPSITYALRGLVYLQVDIEGPGHDLHSGIFGGSVLNPINALTRMLASLQDENGHVTVPGFYDKVRDLTAEEREMWAKLPMDEAEFLGQTGAKALRGEKGYTTLERIWARPTFDINGILGGFTGSGAKTVLPSKAMAKFSCRLVPDQTPAEIEKLLQAHLEKIAPPEVRCTVSVLHGGPPCMTERDLPAVQAAARALASGFSREPVFIREGGSIPIVEAFTRILDAPVVLLGFGLKDDRAHSPNEKFDLSGFYGGIRTSVHLWEEFAALKAK
ncbi:MAG: dipeptidase [Planctomycetota bacterium]